MPTSPFQCEIFVRKTGVEGSTQCEKMIGEHANIKDSQTTYQNHIETHRMNGDFVTYKEETKYDHRNQKGSRMKVSNCPKWIKNQTFGSFERDFQAWQKCSDLTKEQEKGFLVEMLKNCEKDEVKDYYSKNLMNSKTLESTVDGVLEKLKDRFEKKEKEEWNSLVDDIQQYKWREDESSEKVFDKLEEIRIKFENID